MQWECPFERTACAGTVPVYASERSDSLKLQPESMASAMPSSSPIRGASFSSSAPAGRFPLPPASEANLHAVDKTAPSAERLLAATIFVRVPLAQPENHALETATPKPRTEVPFHSMPSWSAWASTSPLKLCRAVLPAPWPRRQCIHH